MGELISFSSWLPQLQAAESLAPRPSQGQLVAGWVFHEGRDPRGAAWERLCFRCSCAFVMH